MIEVFKTNITCKRDADELKLEVNKLLPSLQINFDLEDCDRILRVESKNFSVSEIISIVKQLGFNCEVL